MTFAPNFFGGFSSGSESVEVNIRNTTGNPIPNAKTWVSSDSDGKTIVAGPQDTDENGNVTFLLDVGTYYVFCEKANITFTNPSTLVVS